MKTFEEIFDSVEREMKEEEKRRKEMELRAKEREKLQGILINAYGFIDNVRTKLKSQKIVNEFIEKEKIMDSIFNSFLKQVKMEKKELTFNMNVEDKEVLLYLDVLIDTILARLKNELPSYEINVNSTFHDRIYPYDTKQGIEIRTKKALLPIRKSTEEGKEEIPYVSIDEFDDETRDFIAQRIFEVLETIPQLDKEELLIFKEIGIVKEYQSMKILCKPSLSREERTKPEIIDIRLYSDIDNGVVEKLGNLFTENDSTPHYDRTFFYYTENNIGYIRCAKGWGLK